MYIFAIVLGFALLGYLIYREVKQKNRLTAAGKIIDRPRNFIEQAENFTLTGDSGRVATEVDRITYSDMNITMSSNAQKDHFRFTFSNMAGSWQSVLYRTEAPADQLSYRFQFTNWKTRDGVVVGELQMNMLLTAIEKMLLSIDPNTQVQTSLLETKTKHKLF